MSSIAKMNEVMISSIASEHWGAGGRNNPADALRGDRVHTFRRQLRSRSGDRARLAQHLADLRGMCLFGGDLRPGVLLKHYVTPGDRVEELAVLGESLQLVRQRFAQDLVDVVLVSLQQR